MDRLVTPGEAVGVAEEYVCEGNVFDDNGTLRTQVIGLVITDNSNHTVNVKKAMNKPALPAKGDIVIAVVSDARPKMATLDIILRDRTEYDPPFTGLLPVGLVSHERIDSVDRVFAPSDIVRAKVMSEKPPFVLSTASDDLGVILANCVICGGGLRLNRGRLSCTKCGAQNIRKLSSNYITDESLINSSEEVGLITRGNNRKKDR